MDKKEYLTEENYEKGKKKLKNIALIILVVGILIGGSLITTGIIKQVKTNSQYSEESKNNKAKQLESEKQKLNEELETEKQNLITHKTTLENKIKPVEDQIKSLKRVPFNGFDDAYYARQDKIEELEISIKNDKKSIDVIDDVLDESFPHCNFTEAKNNTYTSKYCSVKKQITKKNAEIEGLDLVYSDFKKEFDSFDNISYYIFGGFIIFVGGVISFSIFMFAKRREIVAFTAQQVMPITKEGVEKMTPTIGKAVGTISKDIAKGIKEGINEADNNQNK